MSPATTQPPVLRLRKILVPTDFSDASKQALPYAVALARQFNASITVIHVVPAPVPAGLNHIGIVLEEKRLTSEAETALARFREKEFPPELKLDTLLLAGGPAHTLCEAAKTVEADLIILATHGHTGLKHFLLGSTAERVVRHAPCPVLVVREHWLEIKFPREPAFTFKRILAPIDFSEASRKALCYAASFARQFDGATTLLHVVEPPPYPEFGYAPVPLQEAKRKQAAQEKLERLRNEPPLNLALCADAGIRTGNASHEIVSHATDEKTDLIILSTHGHTGLVHMLLGSTTEKVVRHAPCPVL